VKSKKIITAFLILVLVIQLLPVRQVVRYFFIDNPANEELVETSKGATKNLRFLDEDHHWLPGPGSAFAITKPEEKSFYLHFSETIPAFHIAEIQTPPPNRA
jgi:hypothetical protein